MIALVEYRSGNKNTALSILNSLKENSTLSQERGMYWKENQLGARWHQASVETQALLIEAFSEIDDPTLSDEEKSDLIDALKVWLLKNKQTNQWASTKATTEAIYALMLQGND